ncbi:hypothetical protein MNBD_NITROSPINAE02-2005 [hydrothermal vent metagenome]|uniref:Cation/H+ exchanger transmembrane domain-containing protein n=1 Tax=hydrothermal vent metagenome TaxID=652676 RepID=A0A3B1C268_9ZZZZ
MILLRKIVIIAMLLCLAFIARKLHEPMGHGAPLAESAFSLGFLLLFAFLFGRIAILLKAPMITGFLVAGAVAGPFGLGIITSEGAEPLRLMDNLALALIAFSAGGELNINKYKEQMKGLMWTLGAQTVFVFVLVFSLFSFLFISVDLFNGSTGISIAAAMLLGIVATANSPATAIAVITETRSKGPVSDNIIGVTVVKDVMVIILFGLAISLTEALMGGDGGVSFSFAGHIIYELAVSAVVGVVIGFAMITYLEGGDDNVALFLVGMGLIVVEICLYLEIRPLLASIMAGFVVENVSAKGEKLMLGLRTSSLPIFVIFFSLAGQGLDMNALIDMWPLALALVATRMVGVRFGSIYGAAKVYDNVSIGRFAWTGFVGQAGVSLGFALMIGDQFPGWGAKLATLIVAGVVINQLVGPIMMKRSLTLAGEVEVESDEREKS